MSQSQQLQQLKKQLWNIANDLRGKMGADEFRDYILGFIFYKYLSDKFASFANNILEEEDEGFNDFAKLDIKNTEHLEYIKEVRKNAIDEIGYALAPNQLFHQLAKRGKQAEDSFILDDLTATLKAIEQGTLGTESEDDFANLFDDIDLNSTKLGNSPDDRNELIAKVLSHLDNIDFDLSNSESDVLGDAYEYLIGEFASGAGKKAGEFYTPQMVSTLLAKIVTEDSDMLASVYDPTCGSGSLLLRVKREAASVDMIYGQEMNRTTYNLARMNMFLHNINYDKFNIVLGNTLLNPHVGAAKPFDAIVSNPPYSVNWIGSDDPTLINDERFAPAGVLAPKSKADFAFVLHALNYLSSKGRAAIVCFLGIFYRGGAEQKIRQYLIDNNYVESVISLAPNLFFGTTISVNILVLSKHKTDSKTQFIDASKLFKAETNTNILTDEHIAQLMVLFDSKTDAEYLAVSVDNTAIATNDYNLSVSAYVEAENTREVIDITTLNAELKITVAKINQLRTDIDKIVAEIEA